MTDQTAAETTKKELRSAERFVAQPKTEHTTYVKGFWKPIKFQEIKKGFVFRLWDIDKKGNRTPDHLVDGKHDVCVATGDAFVGGESFGIESYSINAF